MTNNKKLPFPLELISLGCIKTSLRSNGDNNLPFEIMRVNSNKGTITIRCTKVISSNPLFLTVFTTKGIFELTLNVTKALANKTDYTLKFLQFKLLNAQEFVITKGTSYVHVITPSVKTKSEPKGAVLPRQICLYSLQHICIECSSHKEANEIKKVLALQKEINIKSTTNTEFFTIDISKKVVVFSSVIVVPVSPEHHEKIKTICEPITRSELQKLIQKASEEGVTHD